MQDLAVLTGGQLITEETGGKLETATLDMMGKCKRVVVTKDDTIFMDGAGSKKDIDERVGQIKDAIDLTTSTYDKEKLQERLAKLSGGIALIKVGGASEVEVGEKKDRIDDALNATRAAVQEGIVPGGGVALLYATHSLNSIKLENADQQHGVSIIRNALKDPVVAIARNAGHQGEVVAGKLLEAAVGKPDNFAFGFNAQTGEYGDMFKAGIVDPMKVVRTALVDAAGVASLMTTTEVSVVEAAKKEDNASGSHAGHNHNAGGMGF
jgi:chaperonin GroEL